MIRNISMTNIHTYLHDISMTYTYIFTYVQLDVYILLIYIYPTPPNIPYISCVTKHRLQGPLLQCHRGGWRNFSNDTALKVDASGSHTFPIFTPNGGEFSKGNDGNGTPKISGKSRWKWGIFLVRFFFKTLTFDIGIFLGLKCFRV